MNPIGGNKVAICVRSGRIQELLIDNKERRNIAAVINGNGNEIGSIYHRGGVIQSIPSRDFRNIIASSNIGVTAQQHRFERS